MNSQQELLDAINTITQSKDRSCDTPATVLRVEGDVAWVHIDGGADETPVQKTINCSEGETVQVRISNGSAFLVGNASAPPTDDKTANVAHFVAEQADEKATKAIETVNAIVQTVQGKVDSGDSNVSVLSSTMYQNEYGVNIYNDDLAVGDSYAHIDGDSFDIKECTTAGTIDDVNDETIATFGATTKIGKSSEYHLEMGQNGFEIYDGGLSLVTIDYYGLMVGLPITNWAFINNYAFEAINKENPNDQFDGNYAHDGVYLSRKIYEGGNYYLKFLSIDTDGITMSDGGIYDDQGTSKLPAILTSSTISASATSYTFMDSRIKSDSVIDIYDTIFNFNATNAVTVNGSCTVTFPAQSSTHQIKLFIYGWNKED